eukprot:TRINITY_DN5826_c0_g1_i1.p1 TRINITY_DN5826_c0_g1~~TRINITY_DN5826_c0_g1_i1.p1  ORF type:complete len:452 (+),score=128.10 TRINITY_DN5826_c0_g1_i1:29-1357(+)
MATVTTMTPSAPLKDFLAITDPKKLREGAAGVTLTESDSVYLRDLLTSPARFSEESVAVPNLLLFPSLVPEDIFFDVVQKGLLYTADPYYMLCAATSLQEGSHSHSHTLSPEESEVVKEILLEISSHEVGPLADCAFNAVCPLLLPGDDNLVVVSYLEHPTQSVREQALDWMKTNLSQSMDATDIAFLLLEAYVSPKILDDVTSKLSAHAEEEASKATLAAASLISTNTDTPSLTMEWPTFTIEEEKEPVISRVKFSRGVSLRRVIYGVFEKAEKDDDGMMGVEALRATLSELGWVGEEESVEELFETADVTGREGIDREELYSILQDKLLVDDAVLDMMTKVQDGDSLEEAELLATANPKIQLDGVESVFTRFDNDRDGYIGVEDLCHVLPEITGEPISREEATEMINNADQDGDGKLNLSEFEQFLQTTLSEMGGEEEND